MSNYARAPSETGFGDTPENLRVDHSGDSIEVLGLDLHEVESTCSSKCSRVENKKKVGSVSLRSQISQLVAYCIAEPQTSQTNSIEQVVQILNATREISEDLPLYLFAVELLENPTRRDIFVKIPEGRRVAYLRRFYGRMNI